MPNSIPINWLTYWHFVNACLSISFCNVDDIVFLFPSHKNVIYTVFQRSHWLLHYWFLSLLIADLLFLEHCVHLPYDLYLLCKEITYTPMCETVNYMLTSPNLCLHSYYFQSDKTFFYKFMSLMWYFNIYQKTCDGHITNPI